MPLANHLDSSEAALLDAVNAARQLDTASATEATAELRSRLTIGMYSVRAVTGTKAGTGPQGGRDYALDAARAVLMMLGVVLHSASAYSVHGEWVVRDTQNSIVLDWLLESIHLFRMPAFFWISGYFFALTMNKGDRRVALGRRLFRILVPAIVTWLTFNVAQEWIVAVAQHKDPVQTIMHGGVPIWHLWFLLDLALLTVVASLAFALPERVIEGVKSRLPEVATVPGVLLALTAVSFGIVTMARLSGIAYVSLGGVTNINRLATYLPYFGVGAAMYHLTGIRRAFLRVPPVLALFALPLGVYLQTFRRDETFVAELAAPGEQLMTWICIAVVLQLFYRVIRRESRAVATLSDASYTVYLTHHAIMVGLVLLLLPLPLGALPKFLISCVVAFIVSAAIHLVIVKRSRVAQLLFNGKWARRSPRPVAAPAASPA